MKLEIDIPKEFEEHFDSDQFEDSLRRLSADAHLIAGNYEQELAVMLIKAFREAEPARHGHWIKDIDENSVGCSECHTWLSFDSVGSIEDYDPVKDFELHYCQYCGAKMDEVTE